MVLPANSTAITFQNINFELGASNTTPRSLNDQSVRLITAGTGHTINTTSGGKIAFGDLSTGYIPEYFQGSNTPAISIQGSTADSNGTIGAIVQAGANTVLNLIRKYPSGQTLSGISIAWGGSNNSSAPSTLASVPYGVCTDSSNNFYYLTSSYYNSKFNFYYLILTKVNSSGAYVWSSNALYQDSFLFFSQMTKSIAIDSAGKVYFFAGGASGANSVFNILDGTTGTVTSNISWNFTGASMTGHSIRNFVSDRTGTYVYATGSVSNASVAWPTIFSVNTTSGNTNWISALPNSSYNFVRGPAVYSNGSIVLAGYVASAANAMVLYNVYANGVLNTTNWPKTISFSNTDPNTSTIVAPNLVIDNADNLYLSYSSANTVGIAPAHTIFLSLDSTGAKRWERSIYSTNTTSSTGQVSLGISGANKLIMSVQSVNSTSSVSTNETIIANAAGPKTGTYALPGFTIATSSEAVIVNSAAGVTSVTSLTPAAVTGVALNIYNYVTAVTNNFSNIATTNL